MVDPSKLQHNLKRLTGEENDVPTEKLTWFINEDEEAQMDVPDDVTPIDISQENAMQLDILSSLFGKDDAVIMEDAVEEQEEEEELTQASPVQPQDDKFAVNTNLRSLVFGDSGTLLLFLLI